MPPSQPKTTLLQLAGLLQTFSAEIIEVLNDEVDFANEKSVAEFQSRLASFPTSKVLLPLFAPLSPLGTIVSLIHRVRTPNRAPQNAQNENAPYLAATNSMPPPLKQLPRVGIPTHRNTADHPPLSPSLQRRLRATARNLRGFDDKKFVTVSVSPSDRPFANPRLLRTALTSGGFPAPLAVIPSANPRISLVCAGDGDLVHTETAYKNFTNSCEVNLPKVVVSDIHNLVDNCQSPEELASFLVPVTKEKQRLESPSCPWRPRVHFARFLGKVQEQLKCKLQLAQPNHPALRQHDSAAVSGQPADPPSATHLRRQNEEVAAEPPPINNESLPVPRPIPNCRNNGSSDSPNPKRPKPSSRDERMVDDDEDWVDPPDDGFVIPRKTANSRAVAQSSAHSQSLQNTGGQFAVLTVPTVPFVPNSLKCDIHQLFHHTLRAYNNSYTSASKLNSLSCFLAIPKLVLRKNGKHEPRNRNRRSVHALIRARIQLALQGKWAQLYEQAVEAFGLTFIPKPQCNEPFRRCKRAIQAGAIAKAAHSLVQTVPQAPYSEENAVLLSNMHPDPQQPVGALHRGSLPPPYKFTEADVRREIRAFPFHSCPGPDGLRPSHLKLIPHTPGGEEPSRSSLRELTMLCNSLVNGDVPTSITPNLAGGSLIGIPKSQDNPSKLRPIAIGLVLRRLVGRLLLHALIHDNVADIISYFLPFQLAVGTKGGAETIVHAVRATLRSLSNERIVVILIDAKNAFNAIERSVILEEVIKRAPGIARWVHFTYGQPSILRFGKYVILSKTGTQQGDPLSMLLFALALQPLIRSLHIAFPHLPLNAFYADDGTIIASESQALPIISFLQHNGIKYGFNLSLPKTVIWCLHHESAVTLSHAQSPCRVSDGGAFSLLGAPIGQSDACSTQISRRMDVVKIMWQRLRQLNDPQIAFHLLSNCASACRLIYLLRCTPPQIIQSTAKEFDCGMRRVLEDTHRQLTDSSWKNARLPVSMGGLGISSTFDICEASYIGSLIANINLIQTVMHNLHFHLRSHIDYSVNMLHTRYNLPPSLQSHVLVQRAGKPGEYEKFKDQLSTIIHKKQLESVFCDHVGISQSKTDKRIRLESVSTSAAARIVTQLPRSNAGLRVEPEIWTTIIDRRLGNPIYSGRLFCPRCRSRGRTNELDLFGYHATSCAVAEGYIRRHNGLRDKLYAMLAAPNLGLQLIKEWYFPQDLHLPREQRRRMDIVIDDIAFSPRRQAFDVTVFSPHTSTYHSLSLDKAFQKVSDIKVRKYQDLCNELSIDLHTIAFDTYGSISKGSQQAIQLMADFFAKKRGSSPVDERHTIISKLSFWVAETAAVAINRRHLDFNTPA